MNTTRNDPDASMPLTGEWHERIANARTPDDLVMVTRSFLESWDEVELAKLPPAVRPVNISNLEDLASIAYDLALERLKANLPHDAERLTSRMHAFFSHAAARAALLASHRSQP